MSNRFSKVGAQQVPLLGGNAKMASDPKRNQTVLHLSTLGAIRGEQNNTFVDDSPNRYTITRTGNVAPSTFSPYGDSWSNYFDGNGDNLLLAANAALHLPGDFTIECWVYPVAAQSAVILNKGGGLNIGWASYEIVQDASYNINFAGSSTNTGYNIGSETGATGKIGTVTPNQWNHIAVTRSGNVWRGFVNGVQGYTQTLALNPYDTGTRGLAIGSNYGTTWGSTSTISASYNGNISNLRIVKGTALYTTNFTPSKTPLTAVSGTSLLTCASNRFQDKSSNNFTITPAGNVAVKTASPFPQTREFKKPQRGWCVPFDGSTQRLETPAASSGNGLQLGTSDFTIECWVKARPQTNFARVIDACVYNNPNYSWGLSSNAVGSSANGLFTIYTGLSASVAGVVLPNIFDNTWRHVAIVRLSNILYGYVDGTLVGTSAIPLIGQNLNYTTPIVIGAARSPSAATYSGYFSGKISNVMIVKKALYSGNFVPMQSPRTADQNGTLPVLLTCQGGTVMDYSYSSQTLTSAGSLVVDSDGPFDQDDELSYYFDGNGDYLSIADNAALEIGSGDFTIECWFNSAVAAKAQANSDATYHFSLARKPWTIDFAILGTASAMTGFAFNGFVSTTGHLGTMNYSFAANTWYHVAVTRQSGVLRLFVNGEKGYQNDAYTHTLNDNANALFIGGGGGGVEYSTNGYISNFRIVKGAALYTASFVPSRKPLGIAGSGSTALLICKGRTATDQSNNNLTVTVFGTAGTTASPVSRKSPFRDDERYGMSYYFDGNGDYLNVNSPSITQLAFGTGNFTIECWIYPLNVGYDQSICDFRATISSAGPVLRMLAGGAIRMLTSGSVIITSATGVLSNNCWHHIVATKASNTVRIFVNGVLVVSGSNTTNFSTSTTRPTIGAGTDGGWLFYGYISQFSAYRSVAKYTAAFTPPISPQLTEDFSQSLLLNAYPAVYDTTRKNAIETVGSYAAANAGVVYGKGAERYSAYFTGASDYLKLPSSPDFDFGTGDFTIETWIYIVGNSAAQTGGLRNASLFSTTGASSGTEFLILGSSTTTGTGLHIGANPGGSYAAVSANFTISQTTWHHIAITRNSGVVRFFLNGVKQGSDQTFTNAMPSGGNAYIGGWPISAGYERYFNGLLHDFRITKGTARYTSNFRLPILLPVK